MFEKLHSFLARKVQLTEEQLALLRTLFQEKTLQKGSFLWRSGEVAQYGAFVAQGCLRSYLIDAKGKEHILQFAPEDWWLSDTESLINNLPSAYFADAIEDSVVLLADLAAFQQLDSHLPAFAQLYRQGLQKRTEANNRRIAAALSSTAEERYLDFITTYRTIAQRVPQHMLASYLGVTPETLSRVRRKLAKK